MTEQGQREKLDGLLFILFKQLRRHKFLLGPEDYRALRDAVRLGFGWSSHEALRHVCCVLWARSKEERETVQRLFDKLITEEYHYRIPERTALLPETGAISQGTPPPASGTSSPVAEKPVSEPAKQPESKPSSASPESNPQSLPPRTRSHSNLPSVKIDVTAKSALSKRPFILTPQLSLGFRDVVQTWRHLRQPVREGAATEIDMSATINIRSQTGVVSPIVLVPARRNTARLLLLVDRLGSMAPFHGLVDLVCSAIQQSGRLKQMDIYYFHDEPARGADETLLEPLNRVLMPSLDTILPQLQPIERGYVFTDAELHKPHSLESVLNSITRDTAVAIVSDAGAARGDFDRLRLLDTVAFLKALRARTGRIAWMNPVPNRRNPALDVTYWQLSTAGQIARHIPMFYLDKRGLQQTVQVLRGMSYAVEEPV